MNRRAFLGLVVGGAVTAAAGRVFAHHRPGHQGGPKPSPTPTPSPSPSPSAFMTYDIYGMA